MYNRHDFAAPAAALPEAAGEPALRLAEVPVDAPFIGPGPCYGWSAERKAWMDVRLLVECADRAELPAMPTAPVPVKPKRRYVRSEGTLFQEAS